MDKYEYKLKAEHIRKLVAKKDLVTAIKICDSIDWDRVKDVKMLTMVSEIYEASGRYDEAIDTLLQAYEYAPIGRRIVYRLTELAIECGNYEDAENFYKEFLTLAPGDLSGIILHYKLAKATNAPLERLILILESYREEDFDEHWAYELAELYHKAGREEDCVKLCDDIILWFGLGKYVEKAMKLKVIYEPLTEEQKEKIENKAKYEARLRAMERALKQVREIPVVIPPAKKEETVVKVEKEPLSEDVIVESIFSQHKPMDELDHEDESSHETEEANNEEDKSKEQDNLNGEDNLNEENVIEEPKEELIGEHSIGENSIEETEESTIEENSVEETEEFAIEENSEEESMESAIEDSSEEQDMEEKEELSKDELSLEEKEVSLREVPLQEDVHKDIEEAQETVVEEYIEKEEVEDNEDKVSNEVATNEEITDEEVTSEEITNQEDGSPIIVEEKNTYDDVIAESDVSSMESDIVNEEQLDINEETPIEVDSITEELSNMEADSHMEKDSNIEIEVNKEEELYSELESAITFDDEIDEEETYTNSFQDENETEKEEDQLQINVLEEEEKTSDFEVQLEEEEAVNVEKIFADSQVLEPTIEEKEETVEEQNNNEMDVVAEAEEPSVTEEAIAEEVPQKKVPEETLILKDILQLQEELVPWHFIVTSSNMSSGLQFIIDKLKKMEEDGENRPNIIAKTTADKLNRKDLTQVIEKVMGKVLLIEQASRLNDEITKQFIELLDKHKRDFLVVLLDNKTDMNEWLQAHPRIRQYFLEKFEIREYTEKELVEVAIRYAEERDCVIDDMAMLALHARVEEIMEQAGEDAKIEVEEFMEQVIERADKKSIMGFIKRIMVMKYDEEGRLILREQHFTE